MDKKIYDYTVIGGGLTGIITALILKKECPGKSIVLFEKNLFLGGLAGTEKIDKYFFDSVYLFPSIQNYLKYLDIKYDFYKYRSSVFRYYEIINGGLYELDIPYRRDDLKKILISEFPEEEKNIKNFLNDSFIIEKSFSSSLKTKLGFTDIIKLLFTSQKLLLNMNKSLEKFLKKYKFENTRLNNVLAALSGLAGLPPDKLNSIITIAAFGSLDKGAYRQKKYFNDFLKVIIDKLKTAGIEIYLNNEIANVKKNKKLFQLETINMEKVYSEQVISTINTKKFFLKTIDKKILSKKFVKKINNIQMTHSAFIIRLIIKDLYNKYPTDIGQLLYYKGKNAFKYLYEQANKNQSILNEDFYHFACAVRKQEDRGVFSIELLSIPVSYIYWKKIFDQNKENYVNEITIWENFFLDKLAKYLVKDIRSKIIIKKSITPVDLNGVINSYNASIYDMAYINSQSGTKRMMFKTPVKKLYHCKMVHGVYGAFFQSFLLADYILKGRINNYNFKINN